MGQDDYEIYNIEFLKNVTYFLLTKKYLVYIIEIKMHDDANRNCCCFNTNVLSIVITSVNTHKKG